MSEGRHMVYPSVEKYSVCSKGKCMRTRYAIAVVARIKAAVGVEGELCPLLNGVRPGDVPVGAAIQLVKDCGGDCDEVFSAATIAS
jgi:hypothetical protein